MGGEKNTTPREHAELIHQWAEDDSLEVQVRCFDGSWKDVEPHWYPDQEYRIKPKQRKLKPLRECLNALLDNDWEIDSCGDWSKVGCRSVFANQLVDFDKDFEYQDFLLEDY